MNTCDADTPPGHIRISVGGLASHPWRMENENYHCRTHVVRIYALFTRLDLKSVALLTKRSNPRLKTIKPSTRNFLHSPIFENGPSAIQGEHATSPFSILREWEERGVTTPNVGYNLKAMARVPFHSHVYLSIYASKVSKAWYMKM